MEKKPELTIKVVEKWLKTYCKKGEKLLVSEGPNSIVISKGPFFAYK